MKLSKLKILAFVSVILINSIHSTILVTQPAITNFTKNQINYWFANFGVIHYNKPMSFALFTTNQSLCDSSKQSDLKQFTSPTYIVVKEGVCSFPKKAQRAQSIGAQGIIFASKEVQYADGNIVLSDDGTGRKIRIAALFIKLQDFDNVANLNAPKIKVNFQLQQKQRSNVVLFLSASGRSNYVFLRNFREYYNQLNQKASISLIYHTIQCKGCSEKQCILQNNCCAFDLDNYQSNLGRYIIYEQFRQYRIFKYFQKISKIDQWFQYMDQFDKRCDYDWMNSQECSNKIQQQLGIKQLPIINEFDTMMEWRRIEVRTGIISFPDLSVNGIRHAQFLTAQSAQDMICESLIEKPSICLEGETIPKNNKGPIIAVVIISSIVFILIGICCYRKIIRKQITNDMSTKVNQLVAKYAAKVSEQKKKRKEKLMERMSEQL